MRIKNIEQLDEFLACLRKCEGDVWLESEDGDRINLKSRLSQYVAIGALLKSEGDSLGLYCSASQDEARFMQFFESYPETV